MNQFPPKKLSPILNSQSAPGFVDVSPLTFADAITTISSWTDLAAWQRDDFIGALNKTSQIAGLPVASMVLSTTSLREAINKSAAAWGIDPTSKASITWRLNKICQRLGLTVATKFKLTASWADLAQRLETREHMSLIALMRFCSLQGIDPSDVNSYTLTEFEAHLENRTLAKNPRDIMTAARRAWNKAAASIAGWPRHHLALASRRGQLMLPFTTFTDSFQADLADFKDTEMGNNVDKLFGIAEDETAGGPIDAAGLSPLSPLTVRAKLQTIKVAANALHRSGKPLAEIHSLSDLVTPLANPKAILTQLWTENGGKPSPKAMHVAEMLRQIAKFRTGCDATHIDMLKQWSKQVRVRYKGITPKNRKLIDLVSSPRRLEMLYELPAALFLEAEAQLGTARASVAAMRGAMLEILIKFAPRLRNIMELRINEHVVRADSKNDRITAIVVAFEDTKNEREQFYPVSEAVSDTLDQWIKIYRASFASPTNPYLFPGRADEPMTRQGIRDTIRAVTSEKLGVPITPDAFRHLAAKTMLTNVPGGFEHVRQFLGHASLATSVNAYNPFDQDAAYRLYDDIIQASREAMGIQKPKPKRKIRPKPGHGKRPSTNKARSAAAAKIVKRDK